MAVAEKIKLAPAPFSKPCRRRSLGVKLRAALPEKRAGWSYGIHIYVKNTDGYVSYTCNYGFNKYDGYKGNVKTLMYYMDDTDGVESVIAEYSAKLT